MPSGNPSLPPAKKRKVVANQGDNFERIQHLEKLLLEAVSQGHSLNPLVDLLDAAKGAADPHLLFKCIYALYRVFASIIDSGMLVPTPDTTARVVRTWISERLNIFTDMLVGLMSDSEKSLRVSTFSIRSLWIPNSFSRHPRYKSYFPSSSTCHLLYPPIRVPPDPLLLLILHSTSLTSTKSSSGYSNVLQAHVYCVTGPLNLSMSRSSRPSHPPGSTPTMILGGFFCEMPRTSFHPLPL